MSLWYRLTGGCTLIHRGPILHDREIETGRAIWRCSECLAWWPKLPGYIATHEPDPIFARYQAEEIVRRFPVRTR